MVEQNLAYSTTGMTVELPAITGFLHGFFPCGGVGGVIREKFDVIIISLKECREGTLAKPRAFFM